MRRLIGICAIAGIIAGATYYSIQSTGPSEIWQRAKKVGYYVTNILTAQTTPSRILGYDSLRARLENDRAERANYTYSQNIEYLNQNLEELISYWYGTPHEFNGTTRTPNEGEIACGYFVSNVLSDLGFEHDRIKLAQQPALIIIRTFCDEPTITWYANKPASVLEEHVRKHGQGFYILGLDKHVGFVQYDGREVYFIHSNFTWPREVIKEQVGSSIGIWLSNAKVIGKLFSPEHVRRYVQGERINLR